MNKNRLLLGIFSVLFVFILVELYIYMFHKNPTSPSSPTVPSVKAVPTTPSTLETVNINPAYNDDIIQFIKLTKKDNLKSSLLTNLYEGTIVEIKLGDGSYKTYNYNGVIRIKSPTTNTTSGILLNQNDIQKMKVIEINNHQEIPLNFQDLKPGDNIQLSLTIDLLKNIEDNTNALVITKLN